MGYEPWVTWSFQALVTWMVEICRSLDAYAQTKMAWGYPVCDFCLT